MSVTIIVPKYQKLGEGFTRVERAKAAEHPGRRTDGTQTRASWIGDLTALKKCILLCHFCCAYFNPRRHHYRQLIIGTTRFASGQCDACKEHWHDGTMKAFIHEEESEKIMRDPAKVRREARAKSKAVSASFFLGRN